MAGSFARVMGLALFAATVAADSPSCEAALDGVDYPPYVFNSVIVGCFGDTCMMPNTPNTTEYNPAIAPGAINGTNVPYCQAHCVNPHASSDQINKMAVPCQDFCKGKPANSGTIENIGWCLYWCVAGQQDAIASMSCADSIAYHYQTVTFGTDIETVALLGTAEYTDIGNAATQGANRPTPASVFTTTTSASARMASTPSSITTQVSPAESGSPPQSTSAATAMPAGSAEAAAAGQSSTALSTSKSNGQRLDFAGGSLAALVAGLIVRLV